MKYIFGSLCASLIFAPSVVLAAGYDDLLVAVGEHINRVIPVIIGAALVFFLFGLARFILNAGDVKAQETGKNLMIWGIVALTVMVSVWGIVKFMKESSNLDNVPPNLPQIRTRTW